MTQKPARQRTALIIGAGPAGLTAALELLRQTDIHPIVVEMSSDIGGICKTLDYKGNRIDIGGHRFFSKSDWVMKWWLDILPLQGPDGGSADTIEISYQNKTRKLPLDPGGPDPDRVDKVMLIRDRKSRIYFLKNFFEYPLSLSPETLLKLGPLRTIKIGTSYLLAMLFPIKPEKSLEHFFINRFGKELYLTFFKDYTEKVWGKPCSEIEPDWGAQRIKGLSIMKALTHAVSKLLSRGKDVAQKGTETSLIEHFLYPKLGPGQLWEEVVQRVQEKGGEILFNHRAEYFHAAANKIESVKVKDLHSGQVKEFFPDFVFSSMPVKYLVEGLGGQAPDSVRSVASALEYRDFVTVGVLLDRILIGDQKKQIPISDNWIYIQEPDVKVGRIQIFNNWSPYLVSDSSKIWLGLEYFCNKGDELWNLSDDEFQKLAARELVQMGFCRTEQVLGGMVIRMEKTYPAYFGAYAQFTQVRQFLDSLENLFPIGRNGMHRYNNQDHSMLTAKESVECLIDSEKKKSDIWMVNAEQEYHEG